MSWLRNAMWRWFNNKRRAPAPSTIEELEARTNQIVQRLNALGIEVEVVRRRAG
jgi:hypothetical protein